MQTVHAHPEAVQIIPTWALSLQGEMLRHLIAVEDGRMSPAVFAHVEVMLRKLAWTNAEFDRRLADPSHVSPPCPIALDSDPDDLDPYDWPEESREYNDASEWPSWTDKVIPYSLPYEATADELAWLNDSADNTLESYPGPGWADELAYASLRYGSGEILGDDQLPDLASAFTMSNAEYYEAEAEGEAPDFELELDWHERARVRGHLVHAIERLI